MKAGELLPNPPAELTEKLLKAATKSTKEVTGSEQGTDVAVSGLSSMEKQIADLLVEGVARSTVATMMQVSQDAVNTVARRKHVRKYMQEFHKEIGIADKKNRELLLSQILEARLNNLADGEDLSSLTNKDTLDIIALLDQIQKERERAELGNSSQVVVNVLQAIRK